MKIKGSANFDRDNDGIAIALRNASMPSAAKQPIEIESGTKK
jgi:hypothetical protein